MEKNSRNSFFPPKTEVLGRIDVVIGPQYCGKKLFAKIFSAPFVDAKHKPRSFHGAAFAKSEDETTQKCFVLSSNDYLAVRYALPNFVN